MVRSWGEVSGQWFGPGSVDDSSVLGGEDRSRSDPFGSGVSEMVQQRRFPAVQRRILVSSFWMWRVRSDRGRGDPERDLFLLWFGTVLWLSAWGCGWLWRVTTVLRRKSSAWWLFDVRRRRDGEDGAHRRWDWASAVLGLWWGKWCLGRATVIGLCWCFFVFICLVSCYWFSVVVVVVVVVLLTICPSSVERGLGLSVLSGCQHDGDSPLHGVWQFWITVFERVNQFIFLLVAGLYRYNKVWLVLSIASQDWLLSCCLVGFGSVTVVVLLTISPSSFERGLVLSVPSGCQYDGDSPLHVVWQFWIAVFERVNRFIFLLVAGLYRFSRVWLFLEVASQVWLSSNVACRRKRWFGIESFWLMVVICFDRPVTSSSTVVQLYRKRCNLFNY